MTATLEQTQSDLLKLFNLVQHGEEGAVTSHGRAVARFSAVPTSAPSPNRQACRARLRQLRASSATGKTGLTVEQILEEARGD